MTLSSLLLLFTVEFPKIPLCLLFFFYSIFLNFMRLYILLLLVFLLWDLQMIQICLYLDTLKSNLLKLKNTYLKCLSWAARHGIVFSPEKYEILYFSRRRSDNLQLKLFFLFYLFYLILTLVVALQPCRSSS